jgi:hypothetical protein
MRIAVFLSSLWKYIFAVLVSTPIYYCLVEIVILITSKSSTRASFFCCNWYFSLAWSFTKSLFYIEALNFSRSLNLFFALTVSNAYKITSFETTILFLSPLHWLASYYYIKIKESIISSYWFNFFCNFYICLLNLLFWIFKSSVYLILFFKLSSICSYFC